MNIDLHIIVSIVQLIVIALGGLWFVWTIKAKLDLLIQETGLKHQANLLKFNEIDSKLNGLVEASIQLAKQEIRMNNMDERVQELSNRISEYFKRSSRSKG